MTVIFSFQYLPSPMAGKMNKSLLHIFTMTYCPIFMYKTDDFFTLHDFPKQTRFHMYTGAILKKWGLFHLLQPPCALRSVLIKWQMIDIYFICLFNEDYTEITLISVEYWKNLIPYDQVNILKYKTYKFLNLIKYFNTFIVHTYWIFSIIHTLITFDEHQKRMKKQFCGVNMQIFRNKCQLAWSPC